MCLDKNLGQIMQNPLFKNVLLFLPSPRKGRWECGGWGEVDISNMADELSFQFGLSLNSKSTCSTCLLVNAFVLRWKASPPGNGCTILLEKNQVVMQALNQCYQVSNGVDVDPSECACMFGGPFYYYYSLTFLLLSMCPETLARWTFYKSDK